MIYGEKEKFAIELELDTKYGGDWLFGKICYWIRNVQIGDYKLGTSLRDVLYSMISIIKDNGSRSHQELIKLDTADLFSCLHSALYEDIPGYQKRRDKEKWARFDIRIPVDVFDNWRIFLIEDKLMSRFIIRNPTNEVIELQIKQCQFDNVILNAYNELNNLYEYESASSETRILLDKLNTFISGKDRTLAIAEEIEVALEKLFPEDDEIEDFVTYFASYRPDGGDYLYDYITIAKKSEYLLQIIKERYLGPLE